jgi:heat shock protein HtpX
MLRIGLFLMTNLAVIMLASITLQLLGVETLLHENGVDLDLGSLLVFCAVFGMAGSLISLLMSKSMARRAMGVKVIDQAQGQREQWLVNTVQKLAMDAGIGMPQVGIFPSQTANAFATGWNKNNALVAVSEGLLNRMNADEVKAVLGHEIGHVANGDMVTLGLIQGVTNTFVMFGARVLGHVADRVIFRTERGYGPGYWIVTLLAQFVLGILASMIVMWFSRWREFRADNAGAELAGRQHMIDALRRLGNESDVPKGMPAELSAFAISGEVRDKVSRLFMSHPPLADRIEALQQQQDSRRQ